MYEKTIKFKLEKKFFNSAGYLDNKYIYDWLNLAKKYYLNGLGIDIDSLIDYDLYYADIDVKYSIKSNIRFENTDIFIKTWIEKHNGIKTIFSYEFYVDGVIVILASTSHNILGTDSDRAIRVDRYLPKWDQILKDVVNNN
ncbi:hypothetical protein O3797_00805 [Gemella sanguinis]|jgi:hypothetical protein|uniref:Acyl-CoA thioesterase n=1 Tax=Gemella sanguinis TaxID=84135 RepID=A0A2N6SF72_9BACL|nr:hypothetical protein [Gemella sanguinis]EGF87976.1 hypothetical protein HMPREF0433_00780 [Gemella sanguinis M325]NKZ26281.1 hypothetical protein [Gemella sanguinis]PMC52571.1 hypothetical protein CJ218_03800 [Gemella sanguinis]QGS06773.1 hypothetical protein FOC50_00025 [Gemella sanguinis]